MAPRKGGLYKRIARTSGTTTGEAQGIMKEVRSTVAKGNRSAAAKKLEGALTGGPKAGVKKTDKNVKKARRAAKKVTRRIQSRQRTKKRVTKKKSTREARTDSLATTPTQYGETSPDYIAQAGDPSWMRSYSEEQIGMMGGRERMLEVLAAKERRFAETGIGDPWAGTGGLSPTGSSLESEDFMTAPKPPVRGKKPRRAATRGKRGGARGRIRRSR